MAEQYQRIASVKLGFEQLSAFASMDKKIDPLSTQKYAFLGNRSDSRPSCGCRIGDDAGARAARGLEKMWASSPMEPFIYLMAGNSMESHNALFFAGLSNYGDYCGMGDS